MLAKKHHPFIILFNILIFAAAVLLKPLESAITIKNATPLLVLPLLCAFSIFSSVYSAAVVGFLTGACLDSLTSGAYCFNTLTLMLTAVAVTVCANNLFNKNIRSAAVISLLVSTTYFILKWLVFHAINATITDSMQYLLKFALPSAVFSAVLIFPFFYLYRYFSNVLNS